MVMTSRQRLLKAMNGGIPDRLPITTHHVQPYFLNKYMNGINYHQFFDYFNLDAIIWIVPHKADEKKGEFYDPNQGTPGFLESKRIFNDKWRIEYEKLNNPEYKTTRYKFITPEDTLSMVIQSNEYTYWVTEHLIKKKNDIYLLDKYMTHPKCDVDIVNQISDEMGERGIVRGLIACFDIFGQPGCWQDAVCLYGIENLILATYDDPQWVHEFLRILQKRKITYIRSLKGARYDILELGGGDASSTVISPKIFNEFVAPYDGELIDEAHKVKQRIVYHTCGGMMPILEDIAAMKTDAMETFTPPGMGADVDLAEAKRRIGDKVCMIGGFDQFHYFVGCSPKETRAEVRRCFREAGGNGGFILSPSDHFFDAELRLLQAFADEAKKCLY
jgi:uroporphyrinogen decarboxylase